MSTFTPPDWESQYPNTANLLKKWGLPGPSKPSVKAPKAVPAVSPQPEPKMTQSTPAWDAGARTRETVAQAPSVQFTLGFGEGLWNLAKSIPSLAKMAGEGLWMGVSDPTTAVKALGSLASDAYGALRGIDVSTLPASTRPVVLGAIKAFEENPSRASGRLVSEALLLVAPGKMTQAAKSMFKALPTVGRAVEAAPVAKAAGTVAPAVEAVAPVVEAAPAAAPAARGSQMKALVEKAAAEEKAVVARRAEATTKAAEVRTKVAAPTAPAAPVPSVAPAPVLAEPKASLPAQAPGVEENLVKRLEATGLTRDEALIMIRRSPKMVQDRLKTVRPSVPEVPAPEAAPAPLQAAPAAPEIAPVAAVQPSIAPAPASVPELPVATAPVKIPLPKKAAVPVAAEDVAAADAAAVAEATAGKAALRERLIAKARAKKGLPPESEAVPGPPSVMNEGLTRASDAIEELIYNGTAEKDIIKGMGKRLKSLGVTSPSEFIAQVRQTREIPTDLGEFVTKAQAWKVARRKTVSEAPATEIAPIAPEEIQAQRAVLKDAGGKDFVPDPDTLGLGGIGGGAEVKRLKFWHSLEEMGERVFPGLGDSLVRIRTIREAIFAPIKTRLSQAGFRKMDPRGIEDRNLYEVILGREQPQSQLVAQAVQEVRAMQGRLGQTNMGNFFKIIRSSIDPGKVEKLTTREIANLWVKQGVPADEAIKSAERLKKIVESGAGTSAYFQTGNFLIPPYEIMRPMKHAVPLYLERGAMKAGINDVFGSEEVMRRSMAMTAGKHPDAKYFDQLLDQFLGHGRPISETVRQFRDLGRLANAVAVTVLSPVTAVKQLSQTALSAMNLPLVDALSGFGKMWTVEGWRGARAQGAMLTEARELTGMLINELDDATKIGRWAETVSEKLAAPIIRYTGIEAVDNFARGFAYWARKSELDRLLKAAKAGNASAERRLIKAGVDLNAPIMDDEIKMVAKEFADKYNLRSDILSSPAYLSQPEYQVMRGLQMFAVNMTKLFYKEILYPTVRPENFAAFLEQMLRNARLAGYGTLVGITVNRTENFMKQREQPQTVAAELAGALSALGALGVWDRALNGLVDKNGELLPLEKWPANIAKQMEAIGTSLFAGAGPSIVFGMPKRLLTRPATMVPGIGGILQGFVDAEKNANR